MTMRDEKLLEKLTQIWGVAGFESSVREAIEEIVKPYADEMWTDAVQHRADHILSFVVLRDKQL